MRALVAALVLLSTLVGQASVGMANPDESAPSAVLDEPLPMPGLAGQDAIQPVVRRMWAGRGVDSLGQPTPDGKYLTFVDWSTGDLAVRDMSTGEVRHLTSKEITDPAYAELSVVSPDGNRVAYHWYTGAWTWELRVVDLDGSNDKLLLRDDDRVYAPPHDWSPDGRDILVTLEKGERWRIVMISAEDGSLRVLKDLGRQRPGHVAFSPDGDHVVYSPGRNSGSGNRDIHILAVDGGRDTALIDHPGDDYVVGWVPDTDYLMFISDRSGTPGAWVVPVVEGELAGEPELVKPDLWRIYPMGFTADGGLFYGVGVSTQSVHIATVDLETGRLLSTPTPVDPREIGSSYRAEWSPDGRYLSYLHRNGRSRGLVVTIRSVDTGESRRLTVPLDTSCPARWSPDSRYFLFCGRDRDRRSGLFTVNVQTGEVDTLQHFGDGVSYWTGWGPDGETVYYKVDYGTESRLVALDLVTGEERVLRSVVQPTWITIFASVSPDGKDLAFWETERDESKSRLLVIPASGPKSEADVHEILSIGFEGRRFPATGIVSWSGDGKYLLRWFRDEAGPGLERIPVSGGKPERTQLVMDESVDASFRLGRPRISPDGSRIAFDSGESSTEVWVMKNYLPRR